MANVYNLKLSETETYVSFDLALDEITKWAKLWTLVYMEECWIFTNYFYSLNMSLYGKFVLVSGYVLLMPKVSNITHILEIVIVIQNSRNKGRVCVGLSASLWW